MYKFGKKFALCATNKINILTVLSLKKILNETKNQNPSLQVKWSAPKEHYCIKCLGKTKTEYDILSKSDTMWFCITCRRKIEEHIVLDLKIEDRCNQIMKDEGI